MLHYKDVKWSVCKERVRYKQHGKEVTQYVCSEGHDWWVDFANKWDHTEIIEFVPVEPTRLQLTRYEEIKNMPEDFGNIYSEYVKTGNIVGELPKNHPFQLIILRCENEALGQSSVDSDLENIIQGQRLTNMELRLLALEANK